MPFFLCCPQRDSWAIFRKLQLHVGHSRFTIIVSNFRSRQWRERSTREAQRITTVARTRAETLYFIWLIKNTIEWAPENAAQWFHHCPILPQLHHISSRLVSAYPIDQSISGEDKKKSTDLPFDTRPPHRGKAGPPKMTSFAHVCPKTAMFGTQKL